MGFSDDSLKVLMLIGRQGPIARTQIGKTLDFVPSRVTRLVDGLVRSGLVREAGQGKSAGGRRTILLDLKEAGYLLCGARISFSSIVQVVLMDLRANIVQEETFVARADTPPETLVEQIDRALQACFSRKPSLKRKLVGVGIGVSGLVNPREGIVHSCPGLPRWHEVRLAEMLSGRLRAPAYLENDVTLSALAELWFGQGRGCSHFLYVNVGPGVRMGIVIDGALYRGATGNAGELGHITYDENGPICYCGNTGCLEVFVSGDALLAEARAALTTHSTSLLVEMCGARPENLDLRHIYRAAREKDRLALTLLRRLCVPIGRTLANVTNLFDTETIIIGGTLAQAGEIALDILMEQIRRHALPVMSRNLSLKLTAFEQQSTAIGGGALILQKICEGEITV